jgi:hypothetical protein
VLTLNIFSILIRLCILLLIFNHLAKQLSLSYKTFSSQPTHKPQEFSARGRRQTRPTNYARYQDRQPCTIVYTRGGSLYLQVEVVRLLRHAYTMSSPPRHTPYTPYISHSILTVDECNPFRSHSQK